MIWKDWPYWLKGGVIGLIILLILYILAISTPSSDMGNIFSWTILMIGIPIIRIIGDLPILFYIIFFIYFFILGSIIGWVFGKISWGKIFEHIKISKSSLYGGLILVGIMLILSFIPGINTTFYGSNSDYASLIYVLPLVFIIGAVIGWIVGKIKSNE
jgi:hypothetical protein